MKSIQSLQAREVFDSRGLPTIEATLWLDDGNSVVTCVPSGTSIGKYESLELRDGDPNRIMGKGVLKAVENFNTKIAPALVGKDPTKQTEIDQLLVNLDGTPNKKNLGANAILAASQAVAKAGALATNMPLYLYLQQKYQLTNNLQIPSCLYGIVNGGEHGAANLDLQEFMLIPASHIDFPNSLVIASTFHHRLEEVLHQKGAIHSIGLIGGFTPNLYHNTDVFEILIETAKTTPYTFAQDVFFGIDAAAEEFYVNGSYHLKDRSQPYSSKDLADYYKKIRDNYKVIFIEDPFEEDDVKSWSSLTEEIGTTTTISGDSFLATNKYRLKEAIENKSCNGIVVKPNQTGTVSESVEVMKIAKDAGWNTVVSHRSGESNDTFIADFAVGTGASYCKFGALNRGERVCKYNRLLQIYHEINQQPAPPAQV